jgi:hypothetical protein
MARISTRNPTVPLGQILYGRVLKYIFSPENIVLYWPVPGFENFFGHVVSDRGEFTH